MSPDEIQHVFSPQSEGKALDDAPVGDSAFDWQADIRRLCGRHPKFAAAQTEPIVSFFRLAFENARCGDRAWFGTHSSGVSLVVGGLYLAAIQKSGNDRGFWLLLDRVPAPVNGVEYRPVKSTRNSNEPLTWAHGESLHEICRLVSNAEVWTSYQSASSKVLTAAVATDRDALQEGRKKRRLSEFWSAPLCRVFSRRNCAGS